MKGHGKKIWGYISSHLAGVGTAAVVSSVALAVVNGMSGQITGFDPKDVNAMFSSEMPGVPDRVGYDLSEDGEDSDEKNGDSDCEKERDEEENEGLDMEESEELTNQETDKLAPVILPNGLTDNNAGQPDATINTPVSPGRDESDRTDRPGNVGRPGSSGERPSRPGNSGNQPSGSGNSEKPGGQGDGKPGTPGGEGQPGNPNPPVGGSKVTVVINGEKMEFDTEDAALVWIADNKGKNENEEYFEGFVKGENGELIPSYVGKDKFPGGLQDSDVSYGYNGSSSVFVVPEGTKALDLRIDSSLYDTIKTVVIPKAVTSIIFQEGDSFPILEKFIVSEDNPNYMSVDGVLYERLMTGGVKLYLAPAAKTEIQMWPEQLTVIGGNSFCKFKADVLEFPDTVTDIQSYAFFDSSVETIVLPESVRTIGKSAFYFATPTNGEAASKHKIIVKASNPPGVINLSFSNLDYNLGHGLEDPVTEILVPDSEGDKVFEAYLMTWGMALKNRYGGENVLKILKTENGAQEHYEYSEEYQSFRRVGEEKSFFESDNLGVYRTDEEGKKILVKCLSDEAFVDLSGKGIISVDAGAFDGCDSLLAIRLPDTLGKLPENLFAYSKNLKVIISYAPEPLMENPGVSKDCSVFVKPEALTAYKTAWGGKVRKILGTSETYTVTTSGLVFDTGSTRLLDIPVDMENLSIPNYVTSIYDGAMADNTALTSVTVSSKVTNIGAKAFAGRTNLETVTWQTSAAVPDSCFEGCTNLKTFSASGSGHNLTAIGKRAFYECTSLGTVLDYTYSSGGKNYYYYYYMKNIGEEAFYGCTSMTYAYLHSSVTNVGARAFEGSGLTQMYWYTAAQVSDSCFKDCDALQTIGWGSGLVTGIGSYAFYGCTGLSTLSLPANVTSVGDQAFGGRTAEKLLTLTLASTTPPEWGAVDSIEGLVIYVPDSEASGDSIYKAYLDAWEDWLGEHPEYVLKTKDGAQDRINAGDSTEETTSDDSEEENPKDEASEAENSEEKISGEDLKEDLQENIKLEDNPEEKTPEQKDLEEENPKELTPEEDAQEEQLLEQELLNEEYQEEQSPEPDNAADQEEQQI